MRIPKMLAITLENDNGKGKIKKEYKYVISKICKDEITGKI
jgi:hypothetical protein